MNECKNQNQTGTKENRSIPEGREQRDVNVKPAFKGSSGGLNQQVPPLLGGESSPAQQRRGRDTPLLKVRVLTLNPNLA